MLPRISPLSRRRLRRMTLVTLLVPLACGPWRRVGVQDQTATPQEQIPQLFDPTNVFREMGLLADNGPMGFIGTARILAGPTRDSLLVVVGFSIRNRGLTFRRDGEQFLGEYRAEVTLRQGPVTVISVPSDERVRVASFRETQRSDESVIFQRFLVATPGDYTLSILVRDRNGPAVVRAETPITVPSLASAAVSLPVAVYQATPRPSVARPPELVINPRMAVDYGVDTLRFYVETYNLAAGTQLSLAAVDGAGRVAWQDTLRVDSLRAVRGRVVEVPPQVLSIGRYELKLSQASVVMASTPFLVAFSDQYAVANLQDIVSLLRWFAPPDSLRALLNAPPEERGVAWRRFWRATDPNPATPEHEAIDEYLRRIQMANERFRDEGIAGWLTERGEVFISLGEPSEVVNRRPDLQGRGRFIQWNYYELRLTLTFLDDTGFGRYRLDPRSRSEFMRVSNRVNR